MEENWLTEPYVWRAIRGKSDGAIKLLAPLSPSGMLVIFIHYRLGGDNAPCSRVEFVVCANERAFAMYARDERVFDPIEITSDRRIRQGLKLALEYAACVEKHIASKRRKDHPPTFEEFKNRKNRKLKLPEPAHS